LRDRLRKGNNDVRLVEERGAKYFEHSSTEGFGWDVEFHISTEGFS
jgi:hypothetical protein